MKTATKTICENSCDKLDSALCEFLKDMNPDNIIHVALSISDNDRYGAMIVYKYDPELIAIETGSYLECPKCGHIHIEKDAIKEYLTSHGNGVQCDKCFTKLKIPAKKQNEWDSEYCACRCCGYLHSRKSVEATYEYHGRVYCSSCGSRMV